METPTKENILAENLKDKVYIHGKMVKFMMESGLAEKKMAMVSGLASMVNPILVNGRNPRLMVTVCILGRMVIGMKVNGKCA